MTNPRFKDSLTTAAVLLVGGAVMSVMGIQVVRTAPYWLQPVRGYLLGGIFAGAGVALFIFQVWLLVKEYHRYHG
jgi:hypothetical protein